LVSGEIRAEDEDGGTKPGTAAGLSFSMASPAMLSSASFNTLIEDGDSHYMATSPPGLWWERHQFLVVSAISSS